MSAIAFCVLRILRDFGPLRAFCVLRAKGHFERKKNAKNNSAKHSKGETKQSGSDFSNKPFYSNHGKEFGYS